MDRIPTLEEDVAASLANAKALTDALAILFPQPVYPTQPVEPEAPAS